jgi:hypothetical protein
MSILDEGIDSKASIECARAAIENVYKEADLKNWQIQSDLRNLLNQDSQGAYWYMVLIASDEIRESMGVDLKPLPKDYEFLNERVKELDQLNIAKTQMFNDEHKRFLTLKKCIVQFLKYHPTWRLSEDERKLIFGENN